MRDHTLVNDNVSSSTITYSIVFHVSIRSTTSSTSSPIPNKNFALFSSRGRGHGHSFDSGEVVVVVVETQVMVEDSTNTIIVSNRNTDLIYVGSSTRNQNRLKLCQATLLIDILILLVLHQL